MAGAQDDQTQPEDTGNGVANAITTDVAGAGSIGLAALGALGKIPFPTLNDWGNGGLSPA